jgi:non-specific serine/threonine protein kinase
VRQIAARLDDRFRLLTGGSKGTLTRHQTLRALIDWSYDLLTDGERTLLCQFSVFAGGWTLESAEAVAGADILEVLASLLDKSLVLAEEQEGGLRYRMLETVRDYALERLRESGEERTARERHADHYLALAEQARPFLAKPEPAWLDRLEADHDNLRAALIAHAAQEQTLDKAVQLAMALQTFWNTRGYHYEKRVWLVGLAARPTPPTEARARVLAWAALVAAADGDSVRAKQMYAEGLTISRHLDDQVGIAIALNGLAGLEADPNAARPLAEESLAIMREAGDQQGMAHNLFLLGRLAHHVGDYAAARACWMECRELDEALGVRGGFVLPALADLAQVSGDYAASHRFYRTFLTERHEIRDHWSVAWGIQQVSMLALAEGRQEQAARLLGTALTLREAVGSPLSADERAPYDELENALRETLGETAFAEACESGRAMTLDQAMSLAAEDVEGWP